MKLKLAFGIILASLALVAVTGTSASSKVGYTCKYRFASGATTASVVIDGSDNGPAFCRAFNRGAKAQRFYGPTPGRFVCRLESKHYALRISVYARSKDVGLLFCIMMKRSTGAEFVRTR